MNNASPPIPPPWTVDKLDACFVVNDNSGGKGRAGNAADTLNHGVPLML